MTLKDEDIVYLNELQEQQLAVDETYIEPKPEILTGHGLSKESLHAHLQYCKTTNHDGDFYTTDGAHYTYDHNLDETKMLGFKAVEPACKFFSPSQATIDATGAKLAREFKYDRAYSDMPCCQSRMVNSPVCQASKNQSDCFAYQPEEWQPVKLATGEEGQKLAWVKGRLFSGAHYEKITKDNEILSAATGNDIDNLELVWDAALQTTNATEEDVPEIGPKNPYLQSLLA